MSFWRDTLLHVFGHHVDEELERVGRAGPKFDASHYLAQTNSALARADPRLHYALVGVRRGLRPTSSFDPQAYLQANPDVRLARVPPFTHYAARGWREARDSEDAPFAQPTLPTDAEWNALPAAPGGTEKEPVIDVIMPVYAGRAETLRSLHRALSTRGRRRVRVVAVDDASPDPVISARLAALERGGHLDLLTNPTNLGFVASANRGMALHRARDVILLNADTEVFGDWVDRLAGHADRSRTAGTVTPWASDATILSYPIRLRPNPAALETSDEAIDHIASGLKGDDALLPTAVGCCMFIRRACLAQVGLFDEARFGRGYGEENDFCRRASRHGWTHVAATNVYIRHYGGRSFGDDKRERLRAALLTLARLHPDYGRLVASFNARDPLRASRQAFDEARIRATAPAQVLSDRSQARVPGLEGAGTITALPAVGWRRGGVELWSQDAPLTPNVMPIGCGMSRDLLAERLSALGIAAIEITGLNNRLTEILRSVAARSGLPLHERVAE